MSKVLIHSDKLSRYLVSGFRDLQGEMVLLFLNKLHPDFVVLVAAVCKCDPVCYKMCAETSDASADLLLAA